MAIMVVYFSDEKNSKRASIFMNWVERLPGGLSPPQTNWGFLGGLSGTSQPADLLTGPCPLSIILGHDPFKFQLVNLLLQFCPINCRAHRCGRRQCWTTPSSNLI